MIGIMLNLINKVCHVKSCIFLGIFKSQADRLDTMAQYYILQYDNFCFHFMGFLFKNMIF